MSVRIGKARVELHDRVIDNLAGDPGIGDELYDVADEISAEARATARRSKRTKPFGERMVADTTETGARTGSTWGPAVPVEFGTVDSPPQRILTNAAERVARSRGGRLELGGR